MAAGIGSAGSITLAACLVAAAACGGGGRPITVQRSVEPFHSIEIQGPLRVAVENGATGIRLTGEREAARARGSRRGRACW